MRADSTYGVDWNRSKNPIWSFLLVPLPRLTRNQFQIEFGGTSIKRNKFNGTRYSEVV